MTTISIGIPDPTTPQAAAALSLLSLLVQHPDLPAPVRWSINEHALTGWFSTGTVAEANAAMVPWALVAKVEKVCVAAAHGGGTLWSIRWAPGSTWVEMAMFCEPDAAA